jgi:prepilin-type N-terminal cleavage/methylation domain-containing protein
MMTRLKGFTLIEMAIVLVIIALLIAGILAGDTLYKQAVLRSVIVDMKEFETAYNAFSERYKEPPGDFGSAFALWGATCSPGAATCNGNGNRTVTASYNSSGNETAKAWKHLQLSGMIPYGIAVIPASWTGYLTLDFAPKSRIDRAGYFMFGNSIALDTGFIKTSPFNTVSPFTNAVFIGRESNETSLSRGALTPFEALSIDIKFDDGKYLSTGVAIGNETGRFRVTDDQNEFFFGSACLTPNSFTVGATYNLSTTTERCIAGYQLDKLNR